jgi:hypothetical protein
MESGTMKIVINEVSYPIKFGYGALRILGRTWGCDDLQEVFSRLGKLGDLVNGKLGFESMDMLGDITLAGIRSQNSDVDLTADDVVNAFLYAPDQMARVMQEFTASLPKTEPAKKKKIPVKKAPPKKKR